MAGSRPILRPGEIFKKRYAQFLIFLLLVAPFISECVEGKVSAYKRYSVVPRFSMKGGVLPQPVLKIRRIPASNNGIVVLREATFPPLLSKAVAVPPPKTLMLPSKTPPASSFHLLQPNYFQPPSHTTSTTAMTKCKGRKNLLDDIGILSLITAVTASTVGLYTVIVNSMTSNNIGIVSGLFSILIWLPSTLLTMWNLSGELATTLGNYLNSLSFINSMYGFMGVLYGTTDVLASTVGESIGIISFILSVVATFPDWLDAIIEFLYRVGDRRKLEYYVENYGCDVPGIFNLDGDGTPLYERINKFLIKQTDSKGYNHPQGFY